MGFLSVCCEYHWLIEKLSWNPTEQNRGRRGEGGTKLNTERKEEESERSHVATPETYARTLPGKPQPHHDTQIDGDGLI